MFDLHTHTWHSDGLTSPGDNVALAAAQGLRGIAVTDHDTFTGWQEAAHACAAHGVELVPGVELSTEHHGASVHLLGYWVDPEHDGLAAEVDRLANERLRRARDMLARLGELGFDVSLEEVVRRADGAPLTRPHVAEAMVAAGVVPDVPTAFERFLADGAAAYVPKHALSPEQGVALIRAAGGVAVLAHPGLDRGEASRVSVALLDRLAVAGLAGVEGDHPGHDPGEVERWRRLARERELLVTGASDFHGRYEDESIGCCTTPALVVDRLRTHALAPRP